MIVRKKERCVSHSHHHPYKAEDTSCSIVAGVGRDRPRSQFSNNRVEFHSCHMIFLLNLHQNISGNNEVKVETTIPLSDNHSMQILEKAIKKKTKFRLTKVQLEQDQPQFAAPPPQVNPEVPSVHSLPAGHTHVYPHYTSWQNPPTDSRLSLQSRVRAICHL